MKSMHQAFMDIHPVGEKKGKLPYQKIIERALRNSHIAIGVVCNEEDRQLITLLDFSLKPVMLQV